MSRIGSLKSPISPLATLPSCILYIRAQGGKGSTNFFDWSPKHRAVSAIGSTTNSDAYAFFPPLSINSPSSGGLSIGPSSDFAFGTGPFTFMAYIYLGTGAITNTVAIFMRGASGYSSWMDIDWESGYNGFELLISGSVICGSSNKSPFSAETPYQIVANRTPGGVINLYINGTSVANTTSSASISADANGYSVGATANGSTGVYGYIDEVALWAQYIPISILCPLSNSKGFGRRLIL